MFDKIREHRARRKALNDLTPRKTFIMSEMNWTERKLLSIEDKNSAEYDDYKKIYSDWSEKYDDILKTEAELKRKNSERVDGRTKTITYVVGTALALVGTALLSVLYACIENVGSAGREAKTWLKEIWKNRPIFK